MEKYRDRGPVLIIFTNIDLFLYSEQKKEDDDWLYDDYHEELLRSRDEDDPFIYSEAEMKEFGIGMEEIAKQMQEHDWEEDYDSDFMDDEELINLLVCAVRRVHIND